MTTRTRGRKWMRIREQAMRKAQYLCAECQRKGRATVAREVDHVLPLHKGGTDDLGNLEAICIPCHEAKTARDKGQKVKQTIGVDGWPL